MDRPPDPRRTRVTIAFDGRYALGVLCAAIGLLVINGISIEFPGIILGGLGYYFCLPGGSQGGSGAGQILSIAISGLTGPPQ